MNKRIALLPALFLALSSLVYTGCKDDEDTTAPQITLNAVNGDIDLELQLQDDYVEPGATAVDDEDGTINVSISGSVDTYLKGTYEITYSATDQAGNTSTATRQVVVYNSADFLGGNYTNAVDSCSSTPPSTFNATVTTSNTLNGVFSIKNFGAFGQTIEVECDYVESTNKITADVPQSLGGGANLTNVFNSSAVTSNSGPVIFKINYQWLDSGGAGDICTSTYTK
ncbi:MAG: DUF5011 domain-containing protein [Bacteroidetes bacterium]|nr:DUF5011 domain-containing protein [Bacteroidota bacterium]